MKQTTEEVIHRMEIELNDLSGRIGSLERFLISKDYQEISSQQKIFLAQQHTAMEQYKEILLKRLVDLRCQEHQEEEAAKEYAAQHKTPKQAPEDPSGTPTSTDPAHPCCLSCKWAGPNTNEELIECRNPNPDYKTCWEAKRGTPTD